MDPAPSITLATVLQAVATLVLVAVTWRYVVLTGRLAKSAEEQIRLGMTPNLLFVAEARGVFSEWRIANLGPHSAHVRNVYVELLNSRDESVVGRGLLLDGDKVLWKWKNVIGPNQAIRIQPQPPGPGTPTGVPLSGLVRMVFYFVYGPTGADRTHALDVRIEIGSLAHAKVRGQTIRLNEPPPQLPPTSIDQVQPVRQ